MNVTWKTTAICLAIAVCCGAAGTVRAECYVAYSLREAEGKITAGQSFHQTVVNLAGSLTRWRWCTTIRGKT